MIHTSKRGQLVKAIEVGFITYKVYTRQNGIFTTWHTYDPKGEDVETPDASRLPTLAELSKIHLGM